MRGNWKRRGEVGPWLAGVGGGHSLKSVDTGVRIKDTNGEGVEERRRKDKDKSEEAGLEQ